VPERISPIFTRRSVAQPSEIDELGHVSNVAVVRWVQEAAVAHSSAVGWDFDAYRRHGAVFVVRRHEVDYLRPAFAGDEVVAETWIESWHAASCIRCTRLTRASDGVDLATARTQWVLVSTDSGRPRRIPPIIASAFLVPDA
jgi:acyl-CoA thioester hydrolase